MENFLLEKSFLCNFATQKRYSRIKIMLQKYDAKK